MKPLLFLMIASLPLSLLAQNTKNERAVRHQVDAMLKSWNQHDYSDMITYTTGDVDWVNIVGMWWKGRKEVQFAHETFHKTMFKNIPVELKSCTIRFPTRNVAIAHTITHYGTFTTPGGHKMGDTDDIATLVFVKKKGKWLLTAGENVSINEDAKEHDPVKEMR